MITRHRIVSSLTLVLLVACTAFAAQPQFTPAKHSTGELRVFSGLYVVEVAGSPEEIGEQLGTLLKQPINALMSKQDEFARGFGLGNNIKDALKSGLASAAQLLTPSFPDSQRRELQATARTAGVDPRVLTLGNLMYELSQFPACSTLAVEPSRSATGNMLFGRNLDFPTFGFLDKYSVLIIYRPQGKHAFASVSFPGFVGVASGMNDAGLCVAQLEVGRSAEKNPRLNLGGTPVAMCFRRLLEECTTVDEAEKLLRSQKRLIMCNLAICDRHESAVLEITPKSVVRRADQQGICPCTNHFRTDPLAVNTRCGRYDKLCRAFSHEKLGVKDVGQFLNDVNQGGNTIQTMIFEPASLKVHLSLGPPPSSARPLKTLDLAELLRVEE